MNVSMSVWCWRGDPPYLYRYVVRSVQEADSYALCLVFDRLQYEVLERLPRLRTR